MTAAIAPIAIALISFFLRVVNLDSIKSFIFDEVYYVDGARDLLAYGVEVAGSKPEFVVHPPVGKWMIAAGIRLFGDNPFGWRIATALIGSLMILLIGLVAQRLFRDPLLTALASALAALDGMALVHSRTALLDNFLAFFILLATYFFIRRNYWLSGLILGIALATKWSALYYIAAFGLIALYRAFSHHTGRELIRPTLERFTQFGLLPIAVYLTSWSGWFLSDRGWGRDYSSHALSSFINYHQQILGFHTGLTERHTYEANPWSWLFMGRPTSFFYESPTGCGSKSCSQEIIALGTPLLWWLALAALALVIGMWFRSIVTRHFDPAITIIFAGISAGYLPWFFFQERTVFTFYAIVFQPFLILALVYAVRAILLRFEKSGEIIVATLFILIFLNFVYFLPIYLGDVITYEAWRSRMWFPSWI
ncbi:COG4346 Predicted membrane-bound dolichyl-phosphate-mannose-protein mannosyltransferase [Candidatus Nanopelagicaceae bacterium]